MTLNDTSNDTFNDTFSGTSTLRPFLPPKKAGKERAGKKKGVCFSSRRK